MKAQTGLGVNALGRMENTTLAIVSMIRQESRAGRLISDSEILHRLADQRGSTLQEEELAGLLKTALVANEDLHELAAGNGPAHYYSSLFMTGAYAEILLQKRGDPLRLIAETVRQNSADYPRPVPLDLFTQTPFDFTLHDVRDILERMQTAEEFADIAQLTTSASRVFLYSTRYLEAGHASMLAEWFDTGQSENP